jgi:IS5 family transposase
MAGLRSSVKHPFRVLKRQFGYTKVRYRGLFKNEQHLFSQFALVDLYLARRLMVPAG